MSDPEGTLDELLATKATGHSVRLVQSREAYDAAMEGLTEPVIVVSHDVSRVTFVDAQWADEMSPLIVVAGGRLH